MNKKLFTLLVSVLALLTCSWSAKSQSATYDVLNPIVNVNNSGFSQLTINSINPDKYYQIEISNVKDGDATAQYYLTVRRDPQEGGLYLYAEQYAASYPVPAANLNASLWKITPVRHGVAGYTYTLTNKATGYALTFNDANVKETADQLPLSSDVSEWQWYSDPDVSGTNGTLGFVPFYAYNHDGSKVIGLVLNNSTSQEIRVKSVAKAGFQDRDAAKEFLQFRVVEALPRVLNADEFNSMIDASNGGKAAILKSDPEVANALFGTKITAEEPATKAEAPYAGYNVMLKNAATGKYFFVDQDSTYDFVTLPVANGGFKVHFGTLAKVGGTHDSTAIARADAKATDPLTARFIWRATYYPTPDSLVLEPLNASSVSKYDKQLGTTWLKSAQAGASIEHFFNTVNKSTAAADGKASDPSNFESVNFNKDPFAVVALTIYNTPNGSYDQSSVLTVGTALNAPIVYKEIAEGTSITGAKYDSTSVTAHMGIRIYFASKYNYLTRATLPTGLYFIQLASTSNNDLFRKAGKYYVDNHRGTTMFDSPTSYQNYVHMPATQWIVKQDSCHVNGGTPEVVIVNREYATNLPTNFLFEGQLYKDNNGNFFTINQRYNGQVDNAGMLYARSPFGIGLSYLDTLKITLITDPIAYSSHNGYAYIDSLNTMYNEYNLKYLTANLYGETTTDQYLSLANDSVLGINATPNLAFQLVKVFDENNLNEFGPVRWQTFGMYPWKLKTSIDTIRPLQRQAYILKVRDNNLIDNGWKYVAFHQDVVNQNPYYKMENLKNIDGQTNKLAVFYLKNDQFTADSTDAFALIDLVGLKYADYILKAGLRTVTMNDGVITTNFSDATNNSLIYDANELISLPNPDDSYHHKNYDKSQLRSSSYYKMYKDNGWYRLAVEDQNAMSTIATLDNEPTTRVSAFVLAPVARELYMPLTDKGVLAGNNIKIYRERGINGATKEYLYEDGNNAANVAETSYIKGFNYLGITGENIAPVGKDKTVAFYVDSVLHSQKVMPQYLLYVDRDTIATGKWCNTGEHGYNHEGDSQTHQIVYNALSYGRVLVNLNDSVRKYNSTSINKLENAKNYAFENYTRLGFVPAIHINIGAKDDSSAFSFLGTGEWLVILKGTTFDALKSNVKGSENIIDPAALDSAWAKKLVDVMPLNGQHQNYAFSFRYTDDTHVPFLMESQSYEGGAYPGCYSEASWVKIQNNVPVLAQNVNPFNGDHTAIYGSATLKEVVNQAQILKLETTNEIATANESLAAANVQVFTGNGVVTVKNAAGKKLVITNILGKVIANTVVTSDNATFAAPAGIVAVAVEGEPAVKAIVK